MAETDGIFEPARDLDDAVEDGQIAGRIYPIGELDRAPCDILFRGPGIIVSRRVGSLVRRGDLLYNLASPVDEAGLGIT